MNLFEGPAFSFPIEEESFIDTIKQFEDDRTMILAKLGEDKQAFLAWLWEIKLNNIELTVLNVLVRGWLVIKQEE